MTAGAPELRMFSVDDGMVFITVGDSCLDLTWPDAVDLACRLLSTSARAAVAVDAGRAFGPTLRRAMDDVREESTP